MDATIIVAAGTAFATVLTGWQARKARRSSDDNGHKLDNGITSSLQRIEERMENLDTRLSDHINAHGWRK